MTTIDPRTMRKAQEVMPALDLRQVLQKLGGAAKPATKS